MKKLLIAVGTLVVLLVVAVLVLPALIPADAYKDRIVAQLEAATGRKAAIAGHVHLSLLPDVEFVAKGVSLANGPGYPDGDLVTIGKLSVQVGLWPLLHGNLVIHSLVLKQPAIALAVDKGGRPNWEFAGASGPPPKTTPAPATGAMTDPLAFLAGLTLDRLRLVDGTLSYRDIRSGQHYEAEAIAATLSLPGQGGALQGKGSLKWRGQPVEFTVQLADPDGFLAGKPSPAEASIAAPGPTRLDFKGMIGGDKRPAVFGELKLNSASPRQFANWAGLPDYGAEEVAAILSLPAAGGSLAAEGSLKWRGQPVSFAVHMGDPGSFLAGKSSAADASITAPGPTQASFRGTLGMEKGPKAHGALALESGSLRQLANWAGVPIAAPGNVYGKFKLTGAADIDEAGLVLQQAALALDAIDAKGDLRFDRSRARPYVAARLTLPKLDLNPYLPPAGSSKTKVDLSPLRLADADLDLALGPVAVRGKQIDKVHLVAALKAGKLSADATDLVLYGGHGRAKVTLDGTASEPAFGLDTELSGIRLGPFLRATTGQSPIEGSASVTFRGTFHGASEGEIMASLAGSGTFRVSSGSLLGGDLGAMLRNVQGAFGSGGRTDFTDVSGSYSIRNGVFSNSNLQITSSVLRATGHGTVNLATTYVNYRIEPKFVASGIGGVIQRALPINIMVPVNVTGPIDNLSYQPDLAGAVRNLPGALPGAIGNLPGAVGNLPRALPDAVGNLPNPAGIMRGLFGQ